MNIDRIRLTFLVVLVLVFCPKQGEKGVDHVRLSPLVSQKVKRVISRHSQRKSLQAVKFDRVLHVLTLSSVQTFLSQASS